MADNDALVGVSQSSRSSRAKSRGGQRTDRVSTSLDTSGEGVSGETGSERTCILSGTKGPRDALIRLALGPDGSVAPDVRARAGGRGAWIAVDRAGLEKALARGKLKGALARAFRTAAFHIPADLPQRIGEALERAALDRLGLEARAGVLVTGTERIVEQARKGAVSLLLHASDAGEDGSRRLDQAWRVGGGEARGLVVPASRAILSMALGRENVVHIALLAPAAAARVSHALGRWRGYLGSEDAAEPCESPSRGPSALDERSEGFGLPDE